MVNVGDWYRELDTIAPFNTAEAWDNVGILVGSADMPVKSVLFALDVTNAVIDEAKEYGCELIITHHPIIFEPLKALPAESLVYKLAAAGISVISAHTNLDVAANGVNHAFAQMLGLKNVRGLQMLQGDIALGRVGELEEPLSAKELALVLKQRINVGTVRLVEGIEKISTVAICGGSGCMLLHDAVRAGAQALITGEAKHNELLLAKELGITLIDAGHHNTEVVVIRPLAEMLENKFSGCKIFISSAEEPASYV